MSDSSEVEQSGPKVFVSYAHETPDHKNWVRSLAHRLRASGVDALLDQWRVPLGGDFTMFMDEIPSCDRVLLICTPTYARKSNEGEGGVGYERSVITAELAKRIDTSKFICVLRDGSPADAIPTFAQSRRYVDFRDDSEYEVRLEELLRDLHNVPQDPEPPVGASPFVGEDRRPGSDSTRARSRATDTIIETPDSVADKAATLLSKPDLLGWKRLARRVRREFPKAANEWRSGIGAEHLDDEQWAPVFIRGMATCEPLMALALTGVDSEIEHVREQHALLDEFLNVEPWERSEDPRIQHMPHAFAWLYHHVLGALLVASRRHHDAVRLLTQPVRDPSGRATTTVWENRDLMGSVRSLNTNFFTAWRFACGFHERRKWTQQFFYSGRSYADSLRAYAMLASMLELGSLIGSRGTTSQLVRQEIFLQVPPMFVHPGDSKGPFVEAIVRVAVPDPSVLKAIANASGANPEDIRPAWPHWVQQWAKWFGSMRFLNLAVDVSHYARSNPELPA